MKRGTSLMWLVTFEQPKKKPTSWEVATNSVRLGKTFPVGWLVDAWVSKSWGKG